MEVCIQDPRKPSEPKQEENNDLIKVGAKILADTPPKKIGEWKMKRCSEAGHGSAHLYSIRTRETEEAW